MSSASLQDTKKSIVFLYISNEQSKNEIMKVIPFRKASKEYLGINLTKEGKICMLKITKHS